MAIAHLAKVGCAGEAPRGRYCRSARNELRERFGWRHGNEISDAEGGRPLDRVHADRHACGHVPDQEGRIELRNGGQADGGRACMYDGSSRIAPAQKLGVVPRARIGPRLLAGARAVVEVTPMVQRGGGRIDPDRPDLIDGLQTLATFGQPAARSRISPPRPTKGRVE
jgi:hypothetical protein